MENWLYDGGATGARTLLGAVASSTIGVAGTVFSITIAALSLAAGQMGPRLLRNFTRDRGNQLTLGAFLGTFCYALIVLRSVRTEAEGGFIPHLSLSIGIALAFVCVATLVYFVGHMAGPINVDTVIELVSDDVQSAHRRLTTDVRQPGPPPLRFGGTPRRSPMFGSGYLQQLDEQGLAAWAAEHETAIRLLVRPGDYVFPGAPIALMTPPVEGADSRSPQRDGAGSATGQFVRSALCGPPAGRGRREGVSPGINDPHTAISVIDRLGAALCELKPLYLPTGVWLRQERVVLVVPHVQYDQLLNTMFHMIRQNAAGNATC